MSNTIRFAATLAFAFAVGCPTRAAALPIATWDLASATGQQADVLSTVVGATASVLDEVGVTEWPNTTQDGFVAAAGWAASATTHDPSRYYEFSITADAGYEITYETLDIALFRGINGGGHGAQLWDLHASLDAFGASDIGLGTFDISGTSADTQTPFVGHDISAVGTQSGTVTFRLYGYDYTSSGDYSGLGNDDGTWLIYGTGLDPTIGGTVSTSGSPSVPEPRRTVLAIAGLIGLFVLGRPSPSAA